MKPTVRLVLITALRDRLFVSLLGLEAVVLAAALFVGDSLFFEAQASALVFAAGAARVAVVLGVTIFVGFHIERLYDTREIEAILSRTISRGGFIASYWLGLVAVAAVFIFPVVCFLALFHMSGLGAVWWSVNLILESGIVLAFAMCVGVILERAIPTVFATAAFYALARLVSFLLGIVDNGQIELGQLSNPVMEAVAMVIPRLDLFCQTNWLVYGLGPQDKFFIMPLQAALYVPLLLFMATFDLRRKDF